jgi:hypothetical protein
MITLKGELAIATRRGRKGKFNVGWLKTSTGNFYIKEAELDQFDEGKYEGEFYVRYFDLCSYTSRGRGYFEIQAFLSGMNLSSKDELSQEESESMAIQDIDPIDEESKKMPSPEKIVQELLQNVKQFDFDTPETTACVNDNPDEVLFGIVYPLGKTVKLDATVGRERYRKQIERLKALGYWIDHTDQIWKVPELKPVPA